jgi:hypothetical protein
MMIYLYISSMDWGPAPEEQRIVWDQMIHQEMIKTYGGHQKGLMKDMTHEHT